jgi:hypothetical protein
MSASTSKERTTVVAIYPKPDHLSKEDFEAGITSFVKAFMATPSAQKLALKKEAVCSPASGLVLLPMSRD